MIYWFPGYEYCLVNVTGYCHKVVILKCLETLLVFLEHRIREDTV